MTRWIDYVHRTKRWMIRTAHSREVAALVRIENLHLIWGHRTADRAEAESVEHAARTVVAFEIAG